MVGKKNVGKTGNYGKDVVNKNQDSERHGESWKL